MSPPPMARTGGDEGSMRGPDMSDEPGFSLFLDLFRLQALDP